LAKLGSTQAFASLLGLNSRRFQLLSTLHAFYFDPPVPAVLALATGTALAQLATVRQRSASSHRSHEQHPVPDVLPVLAHPQTCL
jgi:hypothetical protein